MHYIFVIGDIRSHIAGSMTEIVGNVRECVVLVANHSWKFKPFVANRIVEIQRTTSSEQWKHVPGKQNPADLATRGQCVFELAESTFWWEGP